jgi:hypothetical protein
LITLSLVERINWSMNRRNRAGAYGAAPLSAVARIADPDTWRSELGTALDQLNTAARLIVLRALAKKAK